MKALFLAGGRGSRLKPLTDTIPKPMVPIMNKPLLERKMISLKKCGITEVVVSSCYKSSHIENYFGTGEKLGLKIEYIVEDMPLGTGGAIKKAGADVKETFVVFNSDILSDIDIKKMLDLHKKSHALATIAVTEVKNPSSYGVIDFDEEGYAKSFIEKPEPGKNSSNKINAGIYILEPEILKEISNNKVVSVERDIFPKLLKKGHKIAVYDDKGYWIDIGTIKKYLQAHKDILDGRCKLSGHKFNGKSVVIGKNTIIHPSAKIIGPSYIGDNVKISANAIISGSTIGNNVNVGVGSMIAGSVIWSNIDVERGIKLLNTVVTSNSDIKNNLKTLLTMGSGKNKERSIV